MWKDLSFIHEFVFSQPTETGMMTLCTLMISESGETSPKCYSLRMDGRNQMGFIGMLKKAALSLTSQYVHLK